MLSFLNLLRNNVQRINCNVTNIAIREYAARKGTREKRLKLKKKRKAEKPVGELMTKYQLRRLRSVVYEKQRPFNDSHWVEAVDDVFFHRKFRALEYKFRDNVQFHKESHHETVCNQPDAPLLLRIDIDLKYPNRVTKCMDPWRSFIEMKAPFLLAGTTHPSVLAFCQEDPQEIESTQGAGVEVVAGGRELIKAVQEGDVKTANFDYIIAHPLVVTELIAIRGLMKQKFPTIRTKTVGPDLPAIVKTLQSGVKVKLEHNNQEPDFGYINMCIGLLSMTTDELEGNFTRVIHDTVKKRVPGKDVNDFILQCHTYTNYSFEKLRVNWRDYIPDQTEYVLQKRRR